MKIRIFLGMPVLLWMLMAAGTTAAQTNDFRSMTWGMSASAVKAAETCKIISEEVKHIICDCPLADDEAKVIYTFTSSDKLMRAKYLVTADYSNVLFFIRDYKMLQDLLTQKYGAAVAISPRAISSQSIKEEEWASFLSAGELFVEAKWMTAKTEILLTLSKSGAVPSIQIDYISKEFSKLDLQEKSAKTLKDL